MMRSGKDSGEVVEFMKLFAQLKEWCDDTPEVLVELAQSDAGVMDLCCKLAGTAISLRMSERRARELFAAPVNPAFISAWRAYEECYESTVSDINWFKLLSELGLPEPSNPPESSHLQRADKLWSKAKNEADKQAIGIEEAISFAEFNADDDSRWEDKPEFIEGIQEGIAAWERLKKDTGFDLRGVFRRRALIPFTLVPRKVAAKHGSTETISILRNLKHAHDAFTFGATHGALALMRSVMEATLRDHYGAEGKDMNEYINNLRTPLPPNASEAALHRLRKRANAILHLDRDKDEGPVPIDDEEKLEQEIVSFLRVLRALIEGVK